MKSSYQPSKEPLIRVGIILPSDNMSQVNITLSDCDSFEIETSEKIFPSCKNNDYLSIVKSNESLTLKELDSNSKKVIIKPTVHSENTFITLKNVTAGRGFHWQKKIDKNTGGKLILG